MKRRTLPILLSICMSLTGISVSAGEFAEEIGIVAEDVSVQEELEPENPVLQEMPGEEPEEEVQQEPAEQEPEETEVILPEEEVDLSESEEKPEQTDGEELVEEAEFEDASVEEEGEASEAASIIHVTEADWVKNEDGTFSLKKADSSEYYTSKDGLLTIQTDDKKAGQYYFDKDGKMCTGEVLLASKTPGVGNAAEVYCFFLPKGLVEAENPSPADSELGKLQKDYWYWNETAFSYFDSLTGKKVSVPEYTATISGYVGYLKIQGQYYALNDNGVPKVGQVTLANGKIYYCNPKSKIPGQIVRGSWVRGSNSKGVWWRYFQSNGQYKVQGNGNQKVAVKLDPKLDSTIKKDAYYVIDKSGYLIFKNTIVKCLFKDGNEYWGYADGNGMMVKSKVVTWNGAKYYIQSNYKAAINQIVTIKEKQYYFQKDGTWATWKNGWYVVPEKDSHYYYFGSDASIVKKSGFQRVVAGGSVKGWFYFPSNGKHYKDKLVTTSKGEVYYFNKSGVLKNGYYTTPDGKGYYFKYSTETSPNGYAMSGEIKDKYGRIVSYGRPSDKTLVKGWQYTSGNWYYFGEDYKTLTNQKMKKGDEWGYLADDGAWIRSGWYGAKQADGTEKRIYINPENGEPLKNCWKTIDGLKFYFQGDGSICTTVDKLPGISFGTYNISLNRAKNTMTIYSPDWTTPIRVFPVSVGASGTETPTGTFRVTSTGQRWTTLMGPSYGQWASHFTGGCFMHSIPYFSPNVYDMYPGSVLNALGTAQSHGCVRMTVSDVYWTFTHCNGGTMVVSDYESTPLGTPKKWNIPGNQTYDPTDWNVPENHLSGPAW